MKKCILVLGAGFGGMELSTMLSEAFCDDIEVTLIDKGDSFYFGFSKLELMLGRPTPDAVLLPYDVRGRNVRAVSVQLHSFAPPPEGRP